MTLYELIKRIDVKKAVNPADPEITNLACDSKKVTRGTLFFCFKGLNADGHDYAKAALESGAAAFIAEHELKVDAPQIIVEDARECMGIVASDYYKNPIDKMGLVCVTGTNGKTTTTYVLKEIFEENGLKVGLIGTSGIYIDHEKFDATMTTPDPIELHGWFSKMYDAGVKVVVMEVSAHAIDLNKMAGVRCDVAIFTNLSQDHLDYFKTMEKYKATKMKFFDKKYCRLAVVNADDETGREIAKTANVPCATYGIFKPANVFAIDVNCSENGTDYVINLFDELASVNTSLLGTFNVYNTMAAITAARLYGVPVNVICEGVANLVGVEGRFNKIDSGLGFSVIVDYAHTPEGLKNVMQTAKKICRGKLITVFGCGGNRDKTKRRVMGEWADKISDIIIVTSDNPRFEEPDDIISDVRQGITRKEYVSFISDRRAAISTAVGIARAGDIVLVCGKGAENYQEIKGVKYPFDDKTEIKAALDALKSGAGKADTVE